MEKTQKTLIEKLRNPDRRIFWLLLFVVIIPVIINPIGLPLSISEKVQATYDYVESLPADSIVVYNFEWTVGTMPDAGPENIALIYHFFQRPIKIVFFGTNVEANNLYEVVMDRIGIPEGKEYGKDYVMLGYLPGGEAALSSFGKDIHSLFTIDVYGNPISELEIMDDVKSGDDFDLYVTTSSSYDEVEGSLRQIHTTYNTPIIITTTSATSTVLAPYYPSQAVGFLGGGRPGAEYEKLVGRPGIGLASMDPISTGHLYVFIIIIVTNIIYIIDRMTKRGKE